MDLIPIAAMLFVIILAGMGFGTILLFPITRRLGTLLEQRLQNRLPDDVMVRELRNLASAIHSVQHQVGQLSERQAHIEALLPDRDAMRLPVGSGKD
jgi:hypothetical protein